MHPSYCSPQTSCCSSNGSNKGCNWILIKAQENAGDVYPPYPKGEKVPLQGGTEDFLHITCSNTIKFTKPGCYGFGLWTNILPQWTISPVAVDTIVNKVVNNIDCFTINENELDQLDPITNHEHARTLLAHYVYVLIQKEHVDIEDLDKYLNPGMFNINNDLLLLVRERQGEETLIVSTLGTRMRVNLDPKASGPFTSVKKIKNAYLGAPIVTERYYHVQDVQKGDKFFYRSLNGTIRHAKEKISTGIGEGTNFNPFFLYITQICSQQQQQKQSDCKKDSSGIIYFL